MRSNWVHYLLILVCMQFSVVSCASNHHRTERTAPAGRVAFIINPLSVARDVQTEEGLKKTVETLRVFSNLREEEFCQIASVVSYCGKIERLPQELQAHYYVCRLRLTEEDKEFWVDFDNPSESIACYQVLVKRSGNGGIDFLSSCDDGVASDGVRRLGYAAVPGLLELLSSEHGGTRRAAATALVGILGKPVNKDRLEGKEFKGVALELRQWWEKNSSKTVPDRAIEIVKEDGLSGLYHGSGLLLGEGDKRGIRGFLEVIELLSEAAARTKIPRMVREDVILGVRGCLIGRGLLQREQLDYVTEEYLTGMVAKVRALWQEKRDFIYWDKEQNMFFVDNSAQQQGSPIDSRTRQPLTKEQIDQLRKEEAEFEKLLSELHQKQEKSWQGLIESK